MVWRGLSACWERWRSRSCRNGPEICTKEPRSEVARYETSVREASARSFGGGARSHILSVSDGSKVSGTAHTLITGSILPELIQCFPSKLSIVHQAVLSGATKLEGLVMYGHTCDQRSRAVPLSLSRASRHLSLDTGTPDTTSGSPTLAPRGRVNG